tara:strand:+ start:219 stop:509 length:291 start_codon:yes stop_codon:yes gene_type:complete
MEKGSSAYQCFSKKLCGNTDFLYTEDTVTAISFTTNNEVLSKHTETYEIVLRTSEKIELRLPESGQTFTYEIFEGGIYHKFEEHGFTEFYEQQKYP